MLSVRKVIKNVVQTIRQTLNNNKVKLLSQENWSTLSLDGVKLQKYSRDVVRLPESELRTRSIDVVNSGFFSRVRPIALNFIQSFQRRVSSPLCLHAQKLTKRAVFGETAPFFALVGVTLISSNNIEILATKNDELERICCKIREATLRAGILQVLGSFSPCVKGDDGESTLTNDALAESSCQFCFDDLIFGPLIGKGCNAAVYAAAWKNGDDKFPLAVKMMYNYEAESNAPAILSAMYKEIIPAQTVQLGSDLDTWKSGLFGDVPHLPTHPNVVDMQCVFVESVQLFNDSMDIYPHALPARLNPLGYGRNMSLYCVMKRYDLTLNEYLARGPPSPRTSLILLTQLLEAVLHINTHKIVHRDLKTNNILLSIEDSWDSPLLVLTDFGCCLPCPDKSMSVPFLSRASDPRQGNCALMAPEVKLATPGLRYIDFSGADIWAVGTLAYEIYGLQNPFLHCHPASELPCSDTVLESSNYKESQLPKLPKNLPITIRYLIQDLLRRDPRDRPKPAVAANICQLLLWAPKKWLNRYILSLSTHSEIMEWLLCMTTKVLCESRVAASTKTAKEGYALEYTIVSTFLSRVQYSDIIAALRWNRAF